MKKAVKTIIKESSIKDFEKTQGILRSMGIKGFLFSDL